MVTRSNILSKQFGTNMISRMISCMISLPTNNCFLTATNMEWVKCHSHSSNISGTNGTLYLVWPFNRQFSRNCASLQYCNQFSCSLSVEQCHYGHVIWLLSRVIQFLKIKYSHSKKPGHRSIQIQKPKQNYNPSPATSTIHHLQHTIKYHVLCR